MKLYPRTGLYKASNVTLNPNTLEARSYEHWCFVKRIKTVLVFNTHPYSNTTIKHQYKVRRALKELGFEPDLEIDTRISLERENEALSDAEEGLKARIAMLETQIKNPRSRPDKNVDRQVEAAELAAKILNIRKLK